MAITTESAIDITSVEDRKRNRISRLISVRCMLEPLLSRIENALITAIRVSRLSPKYQLISGAIARQTRTVTPVSIICIQKSPDSLDWDRVLSCSAESERPEVAKIGKTPVTAATIVISPKSVGSMSRAKAIVEMV